MTGMPFDDNKKTNNQCRLHFDPQEYLHHFEGMELTDAEAQTLLAALWDIMVQFVDLGFQVDVGFDENVSFENTEPRRVNKQHVAIKKGDGP